MEVSHGSDERNEVNCKNSVKKILTTDKGVEKNNVHVAQCMSPAFPVLGIYCCDFCPLPEDSHYLNCWCICGTVKLKKEEQWHTTSLKLTHKKKAIIINT